MDRHHDDRQSDESDHLRPDVVFLTVRDGNVEITNPDDIDDLAFEVSAVKCQGGAPEHWDPIATTGNTSLRYDGAAGRFVQNWKTPTTPGCYLARVKGDGLLLSALFTVK